MLDMGRFGFVEGVVEAVVLVEELALVEALALVEVVVALRCRPTEGKKQQRPVGRSVERSKNFVEEATVSEEAVQETNKRIAKELQNHARSK